MIEEPKGRLVDDLSDEGFLAALETSEKWPSPTPNLYVPF
jgi:hypothetical protein